MMVDFLQTQNKKSQTGNQKEIGKIGEMEWKGFMQLQKHRTLKLSKLVTSSSW